MFGGWSVQTGSLLGSSLTRAEPRLTPGTLPSVARSSPSQGDSRVRRLVLGGTSVALATAMAMLAPTGASASPLHHSDRTAPSQGAVAKTAPPGGIAAARLSAQRLVSSKPAVLKASRRDTFKAGKVQS